MQKHMPPILLAAMALELGGAETHVISLARELNRLGHQVVVASAGGRLVSRLQEVNIPHEQVRMDSRSPVEMFRAYRRLQTVIQRYGIGLVHAHARIPAFLASLVLKNSSVPLVATYHGTYNASFPWRYMTRFGERTIAVSEDVRRHLVGPLGAPADQVRVVFNGFDTKLFQPGQDISPLLAEYDVPVSGPHVVHASRLQDHFADVAVQLLDDLPRIHQAHPQVNLWLLGDGNRAAEVAQKAEQVNQALGRKAAISVGNRMDIQRFFNLADCVVAVARTALEAMACERPVVIAGEGGYRGILTPERIVSWSEANFTARVGGVPLQAGVLADDIIHLLRPESQAENRRMGEAGRAFVVENLSIEATTAKVLDVYAEVL